MSATNLDLTGKVALVTGGSRGLGKAIAMAMAEKGAHIVICGRKQENLDQALQDLGQQGVDAAAFRANVSRSEEVSALFQSVEERFGKLHILVNNVGMNILTPSVTMADEALWDKIIATNLKGTFLASAKAVPLMRKVGRGKIINISSIAARKAAMGMGIYCVAKAGVEMLTRVLAVELAQDHITVNAVAPCVVKTQFSQPFWSNESLLKEITRTIPMGRIAEPEDVVGTVLFLASDLSDFVTGDIITVDGGSMA
ncbi:MAG: SDR family oxidoreductase [Deltaproteobacteria bacterium]|nr:SDR family oxidoreductase [Deltaproteobacteria bacterium]